MVAAATAGDPDRFMAALSPAIEIVDHRRLGLPPAQGTAEALALFRSLFDLADVTIRIEDVLALEDDGLLWLVTVAGTDRSSDGIFEMPALVLWIFDADGLLVRYEAFDVEHVAEALARFDALVASTAVPSPPRFANAATRTFDRGILAFEQRDWDRFSRLFAANFRGSDRRALMRIELDREQWLASYREVITMTSSRPVCELLATRGDRLALIRASWLGSAGDVGPSEIEWLLIIEVDGRGDHVAVITFDLVALDAAYAELDARFAAGEAALHSRAAAATQAMARAWADRDWDALEALCAPSFAYHDHRLLGWGTLPDAAAWVRAQRALVELAPDVRIRHEHVRMSDGGCMVQLLQQGTRDGGAFERAFIFVAELDDAGRYRRYDVYDPERCREAQDRFDEVSAGRTT
jgi:hypothetical protein